MIATILTSIIGMSLIFGVFAFLGWVDHEHRDAKKWRTRVHPDAVWKVKESEEPVALVEPSWTITYKDGRKTKSVVAYGATEAEAIKKLVQENQIGFGSIVSSVQN